MDLKSFADIVSQKEFHLPLLLVVLQDTEDKYPILIKKSPLLPTSLSSQMILKKLIQEYGGRGGGKIEMAQGSLEKKIIDQEHYKHLIQITFTP
jgi:alanyl-tRNA synthetase